MEQMTIASFENLEFIAVGGSATVYGIDTEKVIKECDDAKNSITEQSVYRRLGSHPHVATYHGCLQDGCIVIQRGRVLREYGKTTQFSLNRKLQWLIQAAMGIEHLHQQGIIHADIGCHNMIIAQNDTLKIIDFEGCSVDGSLASSCYEWFSYRPSTPAVTQQTDIFAFGCAIFELITDHPPYYEYQSLDDRTCIVEDFYSRDQFPDVECLPLTLGKIVTGCWHANFDSISEVVYALRSMKPATRSNICRCSTQ